ncbi:MAG: hypothetical protein C1O27_001698 [Chloroflexi bacterium]|jgi:hypothetical protein|nr:MAG: hypothetical protein C1O27_001698 [Chloroflexota bacterium]
MVDCFTMVQSVNIRANFVPGSFEEVGEELAHLVDRGAVAVY